MTDQELIQAIAELNATDEHPRLEAKSGAGTSLYETVCALSNEPGLGGGIILVGIRKSDDDLFGGYTVCGVDDPDKASSDIASFCANSFNRPVRPLIETVRLGEGCVLCIEVQELNAGSKPLHFKSAGLPRGAWRRVGSTDQRCTEDDLSVFYSEREREPFDSRILSNSTFGDIDPEVIENYRRLRAKASPAAEELSYENLDLLRALNAVRPDGEIWKPTLTGLLLFGTRLALRRELPAMRVDYIRVPGKEWVSDPEKRYEVTIDMRGPLLQLVDRAQAAVMDDLPRGFDLPEGSIQASTPSLPAKALREAIVNALMHRSYRLHQPTQIIRYSNRIEIINAGFSLKSDDQLGTPGSQLRNPNLAAVFHDTNTAETKGTGIRVIREQMKAHGFSPPTFESDRANERFTTRLLLHHFLSADDLTWLASFPDDELTDNQKYALIFARESGAVDNLTLRQLTGGEVLATSTELRRLRDAGFLEKKGGGATTYYVPGARFAESSPDHVSLAPDHVSLAPGHVSLAPGHVSLASSNLPVELSELVTSLGKRPGDAIRPVIHRLCAFRPMKAAELASILGDRDVPALRRHHLAPMVSDGHLSLTHSEMERHPDQAYTIGSVPIGTTS